MKIFAINSFNRANEAQGTSPKYVGQSMFGLKMAAPLACDTVSFGAKNITKVANMLYISQPSLTRRLKGIEEEFNIKIVSRTSKGVTFTPEG